MKKKILSTKGIVITLLIVILLLCIFFVILCKRKNTETEADNMEESNMYATGGNEYLSYVIEIGEPTEDGFMGIVSGPVVTGAGYDKQNDSWTGKQVKVLFGEQLTIMQPDGSVYPFCKYGYTSEDIAGGRYDINIVFCTDDYFQWEERQYYIGDEIEVSFFRQNYEYDDNGVLMIDAYSIHPAGYGGRE